MEVLFIVFLFIFGLIFGSFFNVVGLRVPKEEPFANDRSRCPACRKELAWYELIPVISFMLQGGKCRSCKSKISLLYPTVELFTGILFVLCYMQLGFQLELLTALLFISMLMIIFVSDIRYMLIPNKILLFFLPAFIILRIIIPLEPWWSSVAGALAGSGIIFVIILLSRGGMGAGDMKLFFLLGIVLGTKKVLLAFFFACLFGAVIGIILMLLKIIRRKQPVPFGPYIVAAAVISYFYGEQIIHWYFWNFNKILYLFLPFPIV